jgi:hypothetical protein
MQKKLLIITVTEIVTRSGTLEIDVPDGVDVKSYVLELYNNSQIEDLIQDDSEIESFTVQVIH